MAEKRFLFLSDAKKFANKKKREGFKTKLIHHLGWNPYLEVIFNKEGTTNGKEKKESTQR
jgi:hypothetical protein